MAAFSDKGDVCSEPLCGMRDFLPFNCNKCNKVFCVDHYAPDKHNCSRILAGDRRVYVCPTCLEAVPMRNEEVEEAAARRHRPQCQPDKYEERRRQLKGSTCPIKGCRERLTEITTYQCKLCNQSVCLKHRLQEDHDCQRVQQARKEKQQRSRGFRLFGSSTSSIAAKPASSSVGKEPARASSKQQRSSSKSKSRCVIS
ncbi:an1 family zinc finger domain-containing protein [Cystoisospora suis]|uniref:An1 family zinc finger domain-containing protein n=1 Tax=Cystoisospora suis TaxID=483139 RepID=A0A2C6L3F6_9APIC|nr:an1 family zinc finger domain-containing protein [Cystoisospora suis]